MAELKEVWDDGRVCDRIMSQVSIFTILVCLAIGSEAAWYNLYSMFSEC